VLPAYFVDVAGTSLESPETAAAYWAVIIAISLVLVAVLSPIVGTISDVMRGKKYLLALFTLVGVAATGSMFFVNTGDWQLAGLLFIIGRLGFGLANVFYDSLLPHVAVEEDQDRVSTRGYAYGYLGGGLLLVIAVALILTLPDEDNLGVRLSFVAVAVWWAVFSIPLLRSLPEPPVAAAKLARDRSVLAVSLGRLRSTFANIRTYQELTKFLLAFLLYDNGIGTVIALAVVYGSELGFGTLELVGALVLVQFIGVPFTLMFGSLADETSTRRGRILAFLVFNMIAVPALGVTAARMFDRDTVGRPDPAFAAVGDFVGEGEYNSTIAAFPRTGDWRVIGKDDLPPGARSDYVAAGAVGSRIEIPFNGQRIRIKHSEGADHGTWDVLLDGQPLLEDGEPVVIDGYRDTVRFEVLEEYEAETEGPHTLTLVSSAVQNPESIGSVIAIGRVEVLPPVRTADLGVILGLLGTIVAAGIAVSMLLGRRLNNLAARLTTKRTILLTLAVYTGIVAWGFYLDTVIEFWFLAWAVAIVQGGSQALSRSLYSKMAPASQSGEFFGFFTAVARFGAVIGPLLFAAAVAVFGSSRPAVASLAVLFILGGLVLWRVDDERGRMTAAFHDLTALSYPRHVEGGLANYGRPESLPEAAQGFRERIRSLDRGQVAGSGDHPEL
jgi:UMF1 family MFS transporter